VPNAASSPRGGLKKRGFKKKKTQLFLPLNIVCSGANRGSTNKKSVGKTCWIGSQRPDSKRECSMTTSKSPAADTLQKSSKVRNSAPAEPGGDSFLCKNAAWQEGLKDRDTPRRRSESRGLPTEVRHNQKRGRRGGGLFTGRERGRAGPGTKVARARRTAQEFDPGCRIGP